MVTPTLLSALGLKDCRGAIAPWVVTELAALLLVELLALVVELGGVAVELGVVVVEVGLVGDVAVELVVPTPTDTPNTFTLR